ncbi:MAG: LAGLIDADG family homing endonuclease [Acidiferrobacterales bacterium]
MNCTVSGIVRDSMDGILCAVHEAGLTLKAGCGIGYEFSTLRPKGAFVSGAGSYTSGPLSFMDIFNAMCFTVSSAGGRRGAQMGTFDISHPDIADFIRVKREDGRLRQFNLSCLITDEFMHAVKNDTTWDLAFPANQPEYDQTGTHIVWRHWPTTEGYITNELGQVACKVYKTLPARRLWDLIMASTYDYAEPGFILIDRINEMNNNWFCEDIRATNPCVTADTWVHTAEGPRQVCELIGRPFFARVDGTDHASGTTGFFRTATKPVVRLETAEGHSLRLTADHRLRRVTRFNPENTETDWCMAGDLKTGDRVLLNDHRGDVSWAGEFVREEGYLLGLLMGNGSLNRDDAELSVGIQALAANGAESPISAGARAVMVEAQRAARALPHLSSGDGWHAVAGHSEYRLALGGLATLAGRLGMFPGKITITPALERGSSEFYRGFLRGLFDADGSVTGNHPRDADVRLVLSDLPILHAIQRMLLRLGIASVVHGDARSSSLSEWNGGRNGHPDPAAGFRHVLSIGGENLLGFSRLVGFTDADKASRLEKLIADYRHDLVRERFTACVTAVVADGEEDVYDVKIPGINTFDANGLHAHNCGEQPLPPYGSCLLGSVNLTKFVDNPFTEEARFDWDRYRRVVAIFTRMLDNVVEINGLPLGKQREEITRKRRHGMGFLGLGSAMAMLKMKYGDPSSLAFTERVAQEMAEVGWEIGVTLAEEKGPAPILLENFTITAEMLARRPEMKRDGYKVGDQIPGKVLLAKYSRYMQKFGKALTDRIAETGARFTHHTSIAPTGTISLSLANNASNGIEPSFAHQYSRNVIREGRKTKEKVDVYSYELLAYRTLVNPDADPNSDNPEVRLPDYFISADAISPRQHVDVQAAAQKWVDSSISKTANVPTDFPYEQFKDIYMYAYEQGLKGCTTFRFNPQAFQGVLVKEKDLENTIYRFQLENGEVVEAKGNEEIEYDGETHSAANLYDALKEGYYGKF